MVQLKLGDDMTDKQLSRILFIFVLIFSVVITILLYNLILFKAINNKALIFSIFVLSFYISVLISKIFINFLAHLYVRSNEQFNDAINYDYFRDIVNKYPIEVICKCYGKVKYEDQLMAVLLKLVINQNIIINDGKITVINDKNLTKLESFLLGIICHKYKYTKKIIKLKINEMVGKEVSSSGLFYDEKTTSTYKIGEKLYMSSLILWFINFGTLIFCKFFYQNSSGAFIVSFVTNFLIFIIMIIFPSNNDLVLVRNEKGRELQNKLFALKRYLNDFSNIKNKEIRDIKLWDYYIIYAVIFNLKGKINNDAYRIYQKYINL